jgi:integrase
LIVGFGRRGRGEFSPDGQCAGALTLGSRRRPGGRERSRRTPARGLRLPRAQQKEPIFLTAEQVDVLARSAKPPYDLLIRFAAATGLRPSELCGLRIGRLNLVKGTAEVAEALTVVRGRVEVGPTKTNIRRTVAIPRFLCDDLAAYLAARSQAAGRALNSEDYLFTAPEGGPLRRDLLHKRYFRPAVLKAGLPDGLRVHDYPDVRVMPTLVCVPLGCKVIELLMSA